MNVKNVMLIIFVLLTMLFASLTLIEHGQGSAITTTTTLMSDTAVVRTTTLYTITSSTSTTCAGTGGIGCPHFFNQTYTISVNYAGPWGVTYQGLLGTNELGPPVESGSFFGHTPTNESVTISGMDTFGVTLCVETSKLDASNSLLIRARANFASMANSLPQLVQKTNVKLWLQRFS
jgi:hypothetical protein